MQALFLWWEMVDPEARSMSNRTKLQNTRTIIFLPFLCKIVKIGSLFLAHRTLTLTILYDIIRNGTVYAVTT